MALVSPIGVPHYVRNHLLRHLPQAADTTSVSVLKAFGISSRGRILSVLKPARPCVQLCGSQPVLHDCKQNLVDVVYVSYSWRKPEHAWYA